MKSLTWHSGKLLEKRCRIKVHVNLPRFKIASKHELNAVLTSMGNGQLGMADMYIPGKADFTGCYKYGGKEW